MTNRLRIGMAASGTAVFLLLFVWAGLIQAGPGASQTLFLPFVTAPAVPVDSYETEFTDSIEPWTAVRWQKGLTFDIDHEDGCDGSHCGFLDIKIDNTDSYAIASPLILGPQPPYVLEFRAKLRQREDKHQYGVVFGADRQSGPCPGDNTDSCFNHYYEFRVRFRDVDGDRFLEYRLRRIDGHDGNNIEQGEDLVDWIRADGVNADDWNKWTVRYGVRGDITFKANNKEMPGSAQDKKYDDALYFGLLGRSGENDEAQARFDKFSIEREE